MKRKRSRSTIWMNQCKIRLARLWMIMFGLILLLMIFQSVLGKYNYKVRVEVEKNRWEVKMEKKAGEAWFWFSYLIIPSLLLIVVALGYDLYRRERCRKEKKKFKDRKVSRPIYRMFRTLSLLYLTAVCLVILLSPFSRQSQLELMRHSKEWLLPFQGVVGASLGVFFVVKKNVWDILGQFLGFNK